MNLCYRPADLMGNLCLAGRNPHTIVRRIPLVQHTRLTNLKWTWIIIILASLLVASVGIVSAHGANGGPDGGPSLISLWEANGDALDSIGSNDGALVGGTLFASGVDDQAFSFDGINDHVRVPDSSNLNPTTAITLAAWVQFTGKSGQNRDIVSKDGEGSNRQYLLTANTSNVFRAHVGFSSTTSNSCTNKSQFHFIDGGTAVELNQWYHVAMTYDGSSLKLYVDGVLDKSCDVSGTMLVTVEDVRIGGGSTAGPAFHLKGFVDDVRIYDSALTAKKIRNLHKHGQQRLDHPKH